MNKQGQGVICRLFPLFFLALFSLFSSLLNGCSQQSKPRVVVTVPVLTEITRAVGGDLVDIIPLCSTNRCAILYETQNLPPAHLLSRASLYLFVGGELDTWLAEYFPRWLAEGKKIETRFVSGNIAGNPFVWTSAMRARNWADEILKSLLPIFSLPEEKQMLVRQADAWKNRLNMMVDEWVANPIRPKKSFYLFSHTFTYLFYDLRTKWEGYVVQGWRDPVQEIKMLSAEAYLRAEGLPAVIVVSPYDQIDKAQELARAVHGEILELYLFPDDWKPDATIEDFLRENRRKVMEINEAPPP